MIKTYQLLLLLTGACFFWGCEDKEMNEPEIENPMVFTLDINDITPTEANGALLGNPDVTDWTLNDVWPEVIENLFEDYSDYDFSCTPNNDLTVFPAYPNPGNGIFSIIVQKPAEAKVSFEFVNQYGTALNEIKGVTEFPVTIAANQFVPEQDSFVRVYYIVSTSDNCGFKGHGDIQLK